MCSPFGSIGCELGDGDFVVPVAFFSVGSSVVEGVMALDFGSWFVAGVVADVFELSFCSSGG